MKASTARWGLCLALAGLPASITAQFGDGSANELAPTMAELMALRQGLASDQHTQRHDALAGLMELGDEALPVIRARLKALTTTERSPKQMQLALAALRRTSVRGPGNAPFDLASGLGEALELDQSEPTVLMVELIALLRALEAQRSIAAAQVIVSDLYTLEPKLLRQEAMRTRKRLGKLLIPAYLRHRYDARPAVRQLAREGLNALGMNTEERLFGQQDSEQLAATVMALGDAYADHDSHDARERAAVPWIVALVDDARPSVSAAARRTARMMGDLALEPLSQRMLDLSGVPPEESWDAMRLLDKVTEQADAPRIHHATNSLQRARDAIHRAEFSVAEEQLQQAVTNTPGAELGPQLATAYQELGRKLDEANQPVRALAASRRALRLDPNLKQARARVLYLEAERRLNGGVPDMHALRTASALDPTHPAARPLLDELRGDRVQTAHELRRQLGFIAAALVALAACLVLYLRRAASRTTASKPSHTRLTAPFDAPLLLARGTFEERRTEGSLR